MAYSLLSGTGNRFAIVDAVHSAPPSDPAALAVELCAPGALAERPDGLLLVLPPRAGGDVRMQLYNADGSAAETCGNGLRCVARYARERGLVRGRSFAIEDPAGLHASEVLADEGRAARVRVSMPRPRILERSLVVALPGTAGEREVEGLRVDVGNPHFVVLCDDVRTAPVERDGPLLERHVAFPSGTNVEFVAPATCGAELRVWERGVGETQACGSGACAAAAALCALGCARLPLELRLPGGVLTVSERPDGDFALEGEVVELGAGAWSAAAVRRR